MEQEGTELRLREDPLRALRAIRFASKYEFQLSPCIQKIVQTKEVQNFLLEKTTNERILTETQKILALSTEKAIRGISQIAELGLLHCVFPMACELPENFWLRHVNQCLSCCTEVLRSCEDLKVSQNQLILASFFTPLHGEYQYHNSAFHEFPFTREHMKETWKASLCA